MSFSAKNNLFLFMMCTLLLEVGCTYTRYKDSSLDPRKNVPISKTEAEAIGFAQVYQSVIDPYCLSCHRNGKYPLNNYIQTLTIIEKIKSSVFDLGSMPKNRQLPIRERKLLLAWIENGSPEFGKNPAPPVATLEPTYSSIRDRIFNTRCGDCHSPLSSFCRENSRTEEVEQTTETTYKNKASCKIELSNYEQLLFGEEAQLKELVIPGNASESQLMIAIKGTEDKSPTMPPKEEGFEWLSPEEIKVIEDWINAGAKNN